MTRIATSLLAAPGRRSGAGRWMAPLLLLLLVAGLVACADAGTPAGPGTPVATVTVSPTERQLAPGASFRFTAVARDADGGELVDVPVSWRSADTTVARVDPDGVVTAVAPGATLVHASAGGKERTARVVVPQPPPSEVASVQVAPGGVELFPGQALDFQAVALDAAGHVVEGRPVTWSVSNPEVLQLQGAGRVAAVAAGLATVHATIDGVAGGAQVRVLHAAPVLDSISPRRFTMGSGAKQVSAWGSGFGRESVVYVGGVPVQTFFVSGGELQALLPATYFETVNTLPVRVVNPLPGGASDVKQLEVVAPAVQYVYVEGGGYFWPGETPQLTARAVDAWNRPIEGLPMAWASTNPARAVVDGSGRVIVLAPGPVEITVTIGGFTQRAPVIGVQPPALDLLFDDGMAIYRTSVGVNRPVTRVVEGGTDAAVSPDGTRLAFVRATAAGQTDIWVADIHGGNQVRLTSTPGADDEPAWSPDGARIAFRSTRGDWSDIWVMDADGGNPRNLTGSEVRVGNMVARQPAWSPDGSTIVYSLANYTYAPMTANLYTVPAAGGAPSRLTNASGVQEYPSYTDDAIMARWATPTGAQMIAWFNPATGEPYVMPVVHGVGRAPARSADRQWLVYQAEARTGFSDLMVHGGGMEYKRLPMNPLTGFGTARNPVWVAR